MKPKRTIEEIRDLRDEGIENLLHLSYGRLANGSRYQYQNKIDADQSAAIKLFCQLEESGASSGRVKGDRNSHVTRVIKKSV